MMSLFQLATVDDGKNLSLAILLLVIFRRVFVSFLFYEFVHLFLTNECTS